MENGGVIFSPISLHPSLADLINFGICAKKLSTGCVENPVEALYTGSLELCTGILIFGFSKWFFRCWLSEAMVSQFSTSFPHPSHTQEVCNLGKSAILIGFSFTYPQLSTDKERKR